MKTGRDVVQFAKKLSGRPYVLGAFAPKNKADYAGPFDCAEFVAYSNFQVFGMLYGCDFHDASKAGVADAYTGYFAKDVLSMGIEIPVEEAASIAGAMLLRAPKPGAIGHIILAQGSIRMGHSIEAHSSKYGCGEFGVTGRRFDKGMLLPGISYDRPVSGISKPPAIVYRFKDPYMKDDYIKKIQQKLALPADGVFGPATNKAVVDFQRANGLIVDGEIMPGGQTAKALGI